MGRRGSASWGRRGSGLQEAVLDGDADQLDAPPRLGGAGGLQTRDQRSGSSRRVAGDGTETPGGPRSAGYGSAP